MELRIKAERESKFATLGLQVAFGTQLAPMLTKVIGVFSKFVLGVREGTGAGGRFAAAAKQVWADLKPVRDTLVAVGKQFAQHPGLIAAVVVAFAGFKTVAVVVRVVSAAMKAWAIVTRAAYTAFWALNAAMVANPIGLVVVGVAALAAGLVIAYKKSETFRNIVDKAWRAIKSAGHWAKVAAGNVRDFLGKAFQWAADKARSLYDKLKPILSVMKKVAEFSPLGLAAKAAGAVGIPGFAKGGTIRRGGMAMVGERGPEAVQLPTGARVFANGTQAAPAGGPDSRALVAAIDRLAARTIVVKVGERELLRAWGGALATETAFA